jgi:hypothetical protein
MMHHITVIEQRTAIVEKSQYGNPTYERWCSNELARIRSHGVPAAILTYGQRICIAKPVEERERAAILRA